MLRASENLYTSTLPCYMSCLSLFFFRTIHGPFSAAARHKFVTQTFFHREKKERKSWKSKTPKSDNNKQTKAPLDPERSKSLRHSRKDQKQRAENIKLNRQSDGHQNGINVMWKRREKNLIISGHFFSLPSMLTKATAAAAAGQKYSYQYITVMHSLTISFE